MRNNKKTIKIISYMMIGLITIAMAEWIVLNTLNLGVCFIYVILLTPGLLIGIKTQKVNQLIIKVTGLIIVLTIISKYLINTIASLQGFIQLLSILILLFYLVFITGIMLGHTFKSTKGIFKNILENKKIISNSSLPKWIYNFLNNEEKAAILVDYRIVWYGNKRLNKWTRFKVWFKTIHYLFYEVWFKERLDKIRSFQVRMPRW